MAYLQASVPPNMSLARSLSRQMHTLPPGGWARPDGVQDPFSVLRYPLRSKEPPSTGLYPKPHPTTWATKVGGAAGLISRHASPKHLPAWRHGRPPPSWWVQQQAAKRAPKHPKQSSPEVARLKDRVKQALAKNLNRVVDTFREWDADLSGKVDKRDFLGVQNRPEVDAPKQTYDAFDEVDVDGSGEIDYKELNKALRRRVWDPSFKDQWDKVRGRVGGEGGAFDDAQPMHAARRPSGVRATAVGGSLAGSLRPHGTIKEHCGAAFSSSSALDSRASPRVRTKRLRGDGTTFVMPSGVAISASIEAIIRKAQADAGRQPAALSPRAPGRWMAATMNGSYRDLSSGQDSVKSAEKRDEPTGQPVGRTRVSSCMGKSHAAYVDGVDDAAREPAAHRRSRGRELATRVPHSTAHATKFGMYRTGAEPEAEAGGAYLCGFLVCTSEKREYCKIIA